MIERYNRRQILSNESPLYEKILNDRGVKKIRQYETPVFKQISSAEIKNLNLIEHYWSVGDRMYKLAYQYYGDSRDWWVIAQFNNKPTDSHINIGDKILIPTPLVKIASMLRG